MNEQRLARVSPWLLAAACGLLAIIIGVFALSNYHREKRLMTESLLQRGLTIARFVTASSRATLRGNLKNIQVVTGQWTDHVQQAIESGSEQPGLRGLLLVGPDFEVLASNEKERMIGKIDLATQRFLKRLPREASDEGFIYRTMDHADEPILQIATSYRPLGPGRPFPRHYGRGHRSGMRMEGGGRPRQFFDREMLELLEDIRSGRYVLLIELDLSNFNKVVQRQLLQIVSLALVLLLVGAGGWISLLTLQGLRGSQIRLRQIREFTDMLISSLPVGLVATDSEGNVRIFNTSAAEMTGVDEAEVMGKPPATILTERLSEELSRKSLTAGEGTLQEIVLRDDRGKERSLMVTALPVVDSRNRYAGQTLLLQDVSQVKELEQEVRRNERLAALGKMAAGLAHELRNPLSSIKGLTLLLRSKVGGDDEGTKTADILIQEVERLNRSIGELLDYARPHTLQLEKIEISEIVRESLMLVKTDVDDAGVSVTTALEKPLYTLGDGDKLKQVFLNLLLNSIQALEAKQGDKTLRLRLYSQDDRSICSIEDSGVGVESGNETRVFDPYFTTKTEGTGLGLTMSAKIIEEHKGSIEFQSSLGYGTVVRVSLPAYSTGR